MNAEAIAKAVNLQAAEFAAAWGVEYETRPIGFTEGDTSVTLARALLRELAGRDVFVGLGDTYAVEIETDVFVQLPNYLLPSAFTPDGQRPWDRLGKLERPGVTSLRDALAPPATIADDFEAGVAAIVEASQTNHEPTHVVSPTELREAEQELAAREPPAKSAKRRKRA